MRTLQCLYLPFGSIPGRTFAVSDGFGNTVATVARTSYAESTGSDAADVALGLNNDGSGNGLFYRNSAIRIASIIDGTSQTVMLLERAWGDSEGTWTGAIPGGFILRDPITHAPAPHSHRISPPVWSRRIAT